MIGGWKHPLCRLNMTWFEQQQFVNERIQKDVGFIWNGGCTWLWNEWIMTTLLAYIWPTGHTACHTDSCVNTVNGVCVWFIVWCTGDFAILWLMADLFKELNRDYCLKRWQVSLHSQDIFLSVCHVVGSNSSLLPAGWMLKWFLGTEPLRFFLGGMGVWVKGDSRIQGIWFAPTSKQTLILDG